MNFLTPRGKESCQNKLVMAFIAANYLVAFGRLGLPPKVIPI